MRLIKRNQSDPSRELTQERFGERDSTLLLEARIEEGGRQLYSMVYRLMDENTELKDELAKMEVGFVEFKKNVIEMNREMARRVFLEAPTQR